jgi:uncharacterized paraquat-inducible protein A
MLIGIIMYIIAMLLPSKTVFKIGSWIQWIIIAINLILLFNPELYSEVGYGKAVVTYLISVVVFAIFTVIAYFVTYRRQDNIEEKIYEARIATREKRAQMWICKQCGASNEKNEENCYRCKTHKETRD